MNEKIGNLGRETETKKEPTENSKTENIISKIKITG